jgi:hypothetical protein
MEEMTPLREIGVKQNMNVTSSGDEKKATVSDRNDDNKVEPASKQTGAIPKKQSSLKQK